MAEEQPRDSLPDGIELPAPTPWPFVVAFGVALAFAGLVTTSAVSAVGMLVAVAGARGWWSEVLPEERTERVRVEPGPEPGVRPEPLPAPAPGEVGHRMRIPVEVHRYSAGLRGGVAGGIAMAVPALIYGAVFQGSLWYPINLLAAITSPSLTAASVEQLRAFSVYGLVVGTLVHGTISLLVGLLYAVILPMLWGSPLAWGGIVAPLLWSLGLWASIRVINPGLNERVDWLWFVASQFAFGWVCGFVVSRTEKIGTLQTRPLAQRAGLERGRPPRRR
jgi:hypothetical protein